MNGLPAAVVGTVLPSVTLPALTRATLALYAGGSGDHIPLHIDSDFAKSVGHQDVFMHGMLGAAYVARMLTEWVPQERLVSIDVRFRAITYPGESLHATGTVVATDVDGVVGNTRVEVSLTNAEGEVKLAGSAHINLAFDEI